MLYQTVCSLYDILGGTIILFEFEQTASFVLLLKIQDVVDFRSAKTIDALCVISYDAYMSVTASQQPYYLLLGKVGVLILINKNKPEPLTILLPYLSIAVEQMERKHQEVIEIHSVALAAVFHIQGEYRRHLTHP